MNRNINTIDGYIQTFPADVRVLLEKMKQTIKQAAPAAEETISYQMPAFRLNGVLVYFAAFKKHIGFYPTSSGISAFKAELVPYKSFKGAVQFPLDKPVPFDLVKKIVAYRVEENLKKKDRIK